MSADRNEVWDEYVLSGGQEGDALLRKALEQACPEGSKALAQAELDLAQIGLGLPRATVRPELRARVLGRIAREAAGGQQASSPQAPRSWRAPGGDSPQSPHPLASAVRPQRGRAWSRATVAMLAVLVLVTASSLVMQKRADERVQSLGNQLERMATIQKESDERLEDVVARLQRTRELASALRERDNRLAVIERRYRDLELVSAMSDGTKNSELRELREEVALLSSADLRMHLVAATDQAVGPDVGHLRLFWDQPGNRWMVTGAGLQPPGEGRCYEVWMLTRDGRALPSVTFLPGEQGRMRAMMDVPVNLDVTGIAITDEPLGGVAKATGEIRYLAKFD